MSIPDGMYEVSRKGTILWKADYGDDFSVTDSNHVFINSPTGYAVLDAARQPVAKGPGRAVQEIGGKLILVRLDKKFRLVGLDGKIVQTWPGDMAGDVLWTRRGLIEVQPDQAVLHAATGAVVLLKPDHPFAGVFVAVNEAGRILIAYQTYTTKWSHFAFAFDENGKQLWKHDDFEVDAIRGAAVTARGDFIVASVGGAGTICYDSSGEAQWKIDNSGALNIQLHTAPGLQTIALTAYNNELTEYDTRTGKPVWMYGNVSDQTDWVTTPPRDVAGWEDLAYHTIKHFNKDRGLGWDRWELWNEPGQNGYFWKGDFKEYGNLYKATMSAIERSDPSARLDAYVGDWAGALIPFLAESKTRVDGFTYHGYDVALPDHDLADEKAHQANALMTSMCEHFPKKTPTLGDSEWNIHPGHGEDLSHYYQTGFYRAPFQSELITVKARYGVTFSSEFCMVSDITWPAGWIYDTAQEIGGHKAPAGGINETITPAFNATKLWSMLPKQRVTFVNDFKPQRVKGTSHLVDGIAAADVERGEFAVLLWNFSNGSSGTKDETVTLTLQFPGLAGELHMRHYVIDAEHSTYTAGWEKQWLTATESGMKNGNAPLTVTLKSDSMHGFFFSKAPLQAVAGPPITVAAHHPVHFDGSASPGIPANYRWDFDATDGVDFPEPNDGLPSASHGFGPHPVLAHGYTKAGTYKVTLRVSSDGYHKETDTTTTTVIVTEDKVAPAAPPKLEVNSEAADRTAYLQWDAPPESDASDLAGYNIHRRIGTGDWQKLSIAPLVATAFVDEHLINGRTCTYHVTSVGAAGNESNASPDATTAIRKSRKKPKPPVKLAIEIPFGDLVHLTWDNPSLPDAARVQAFNVYRRVAGSGEFQKITNAPTPYKLYYDDVQNAGLAAKYQYAVTAVDTFGNESLQSESIQAKSAP